MDRDLAVGLGFEFVALGQQLGAQVAEILDDAVMDDGDAGIGVRMGVDHRRRAMRRPARVADAGAARERLGAQHGVELGELAGRTPALDRAVHQRGDAGGIVAAIFEPLQAPRG